MWQVRARKPYNADRGKPKTDMSSTDDPKTTPVRAAQAATVCNDPKSPPKTDWRAFDAMSADERHRAAVCDPDCPPATEEQLSRAYRAPNVRAVRERLNMSQEEFAARFHLPLGTVRNWEQGVHRPDRPAQLLLMVIAKEPDAVIRALENRPASVLGDP
jgi:putative transcriptional regulator